MPYLQYGWVAVVILASVLWLARLYLRRDGICKEKRWSDADHAKVLRARLKDMDHFIKIARHHLKFGTAREGMLQMYWDFHLEQEWLRADIEKLSNPKPTPA